MIFLFGSVLAGTLLYDHIASEKPIVMNVGECETSKTSTNVTYKVKEGVGEVSLPPCNLIAVELGPCESPSKKCKHILQVVIISYR